MQKQATKEWRSWASHEECSMALSAGSGSPIEWNALVKYNFAVL